MLCECDKVHRATCSVGNEHVTNGGCRNRQSIMSMKRHKTQTPQGVHLDDHDSSDEDGDMG